MHTNDAGQHLFSHTSLDLWRTCKRRWYHKYVLGQREPTTPNMAAGTWLVQMPIETWEQDRFGISEPEWAQWWSNFLAEFGGDASFNDPIFTPELSRSVLEAYQKSPISGGNVVDIEKRFFLELPGGVLYQSQPDMVVENQVPCPEGSRVLCMRRTCWDIKLKTFWSKYPSATPIVDPLLPFDDQGLGQAVCAGADAFGQIRFYVDKRDGAIHGPLYLEQPVNPVLADEWRSDVVQDVMEIESWLKRTHTPWPKNPDACHKWGRACENLNACNFGFDKHIERS